MTVEILGYQKKKRLREGGVGPKMRSPAGLAARILTCRPTACQRPRCGENCDSA